MIDLTSLTDTSLTKAKLIRNEVRPAKLAIVGEAPGAQEEEQGKPFVGASGGLLFGELSRRGLSRYDCAILNVSQNRPPNNDFSAFDWGGFEIQDGIAALTEDLKTVRPNLVLCLGNAALHVLKYGNIAPLKKSNKFVWPSTITNWRGSLFQSAFGYKAMSAFHPAYIFRVYKDIAYFKSDLNRAASECKSPMLVPTERTLVTTPNLNNILQALDEIYTKKLRIALDIEGGLGTFSCISFALSPHYAFIVPLTNPDGSSFWSEEDEHLVWTALAKVLSDPTIPKILQNCLYDCFVMSYGYKCPIRGVVDDTMLKFWELLPELEKGLGVQASLLTTEPYYKDARATSGETLWRYCCKDSAVTFECNNVLDTQLTASARAHYAFNMALLGPTLYMQHRGLRFDSKRREAMTREIGREAFELQHKVNVATGTTLLSRKPNEILPLIIEKCCRKRDVVTSFDEVPGAALAPYVSTISRIATLGRSFMQLHQEELGELEHLLEVGINVDSNKQMAELLYQKLALPTQFKKERGKRTEKVTADALALLSLYVDLRNRNNPQADLVLNLLKLRGLYDRIQNLQTPLDPDGRVRASYNVVGSETGRFTCYGSNTGSGGNLQTITKRDRCLYVADQDYYFFQCDLSGADGWTVAAHCAALGDRTMLEDYLAGLKPAKILDVMRRHGNAVARWDRATLKDACKEVDKDSWEYFACKCVQHMSNYGGTPPTIQDTILKSSWKLSGNPIFVPVDLCKQLQSLYFARYSAITRWHARAWSILKATGQLKSASGHTRTFFGRKEDHGTLKEYLADEPQENTTYVCNRALLNIWQDQENREGNKVIIQPLHQMHDAVIGQFPVDRVGWAIEKIRSYFNNPITVAGITLTIPFEGGYGRSWGELDNEI